MAGGHGRQCESCHEVYPAKHFRSGLNKHTSCRKCRAVFNRLKLEAQKAARVERLKCIICGGPTSDSSILGRCRPCAEAATSREWRERWANGTMKARPKQEKPMPMNDFGDRQETRLDRSPAYYRLKQEATEHPERFVPIGPDDWFRKTADCQGCRKKIIAHGLCFQCAMAARARSERVSWQLVAD